MGRNNQHAFGLMIGIFMADEIRTVEFGAGVSDEKLREFFGAENVFEIRREGEEGGMIDVCSDLPAELLEDLLREHFLIMTRVRQPGESGSGGRT